MASGAGSPCGACKFLRRKCMPDCIFAPYFTSDDGAARFAAIHKIFGASNVSKLLLHVPVPERCEAAVTITYEAQSRLRDPVYGCVAHIFALQQQVAMLRAQLMQVKAQLAQRVGSQQLVQEQWRGNVSANFMHPKRSLESMGYCSDVAQMQEMFKEDFPIQQCTKRRASENDMEELQALAVRMMRS